MSGYIELHAHSAYSFAVGACSPREMVRGAKKLGLPAWHYLIMTEFTD